MTRTELTYIERLTKLLKYAKQQQQQLSWRDRKEQMLNILYSHRADWDWVHAETLFASSSVLLVSSAFTMISLNSNKKS